MRKGSEDTRLTSLGSQPPVLFDVAHDFSMVFIITHYLRGYARVNYSSAVRRQLKWTINQQFFVKCVVTSQQVPHLVGDEESSQALLLKTLTQEPLGCGPEVQPF